MAGFESIVFVGNVVRGPMAAIDGGWLFWVNTSCSARLFIFFNAVDTLTVEPDNGFHTLFFFFLVRLPVSFYDTAPRRRLE